MKKIDIVDLTASSSSSSLNSTFSAMTSSEVSKTLTKKSRFKQPLSANTTSADDLKIQIRKNQIEKEVNEIWAWRVELMRQKKELQNSLEQ